MSCETVAVLVARVLRFGLDAITPLEKDHGGLAQAGPRICIGYSQRHRGVVRKETNGSAILQLHLAQARLQPHMARVEEVRTVPVGCVPHEGREELVVALPYALPLHTARTPPHAHHPH